MYKTIESDTGAITTIWLNRPEAGNAFNGIMISELTEVLDQIAHDKKVHIVVIRGKGAVFCSGADLRWMQQSRDLSEEENYNEVLNMAKCFRALYSLPKPVVAVAHGAVMGGGNGLIASADISICTNNTQFAFSEVKIGMVPAIISPYVVQRIGFAKARELMLTGEKINGKTAASLKLVNSSVEATELEEKLQNTLRQLLENSSNAMQKTKGLLNQLQRMIDVDEITNYTAKEIARARVSSEGQEGMTAFLEKRKPVWNRIELNF